MLENSPTNIAKAAKERTAPLRFAGSCLALLLAAMAPAAALAQEVDTGTNPAKLSNFAEAKYEYVDLRGGFSSGTLSLSYLKALGADKDWAIKVKVPVTYVDVLGNDNHALGDIGVQVNHVFGMTKDHGFVAMAEMNFDTARRVELGSGQNVLKGTLVYAKFLEGGAIFAPALVQKNSTWGGDDGRADVNNTTLDFYYVPKLSNPKNLMTLDPFVTFDWESDAQFAGLAVTFGRVIGPAFGGNAIVQIKPTVFAGNDRPGHWGLEIGYKVIGF